VSLGSNVVNIVVGAKTDDANKKFNLIRKAVLGVSLAAAGAAMGLVKIGDEISKATRNIQSATGATGAELDALKKEFRDVAGSVPQDMDTVSKALASVSTELGITGDSLENTTKGFLDLSRITGTEVGPLIKQVSDSMDMFGISSDQASQSLDAFAKASQITGVPIATLTSRVQEFGPVLRNLGLSMNDSIALLGQFEGAGISASRVMPALNMSMRQLATSGSGDMAESLYEAMRAIKDAETSTAALNAATDLFGSEGAQRMSIAIRDGTVDIEALSETLANSQGTVDEMNKGTLTAGERWEMWTNKMKLAVGPLAEVMAGIGPIVIILPSLIAGIAALSGMMSGLSLATMGAAIKSGVLTVATGLQTAASWLGAAAATALSLALSPIGLIIIGIALAVGAAILIWKNWDAIMAVVNETLHKIDKFLRDTFGPTWIYLKQVVKDVVAGIVELFKGMFALFSGDIEGFKEHMSNALGLLKKAWEMFIENLWKPFDEFMTNKLGAAWTLFSGIMKAQLDVAIGFFNGFVEILKGIWDLIVGIFTGDTNKITDGFKGIVNGIYTMFNGLIKAVNRIGFSLPDWLGGKSFSLNIPEIPKLAEGGIVNRPTLAMIGEGGPEAVVPLNRGGGLGGGVTVNVMMPEGGTVIMDDEQTMQRFSDFITREIRQVLRTQAGF